MSLPIERRLAALEGRNSGPCLACACERLNAAHRTGKPAELESEHEGRCIHVRRSLAEVLIEVDRIEKERNHAQH